MRRVPARRARFEILRRSSAGGPRATTSAEYRVAASVNSSVLADRKTELWARVYRPTASTANEKHPVLVFLHGNHGTCGTGSNPRIDDSVAYTMNGTCPAGHVVTPNHLGYGYLADRLASWGYVVVSINANRGITGGGGTSADFGLNLARGRLVLEHLALLDRWNAAAGTTPKTLGADLFGKLDLGNVGLMGHSRGGEGVRAAYNLYLDPGSPWPNRFATPLGIKAIFEIAPVDGQAGRTLDALGTAWNVLLPMCDGDVSDLQGMRPFDRMLVSTSPESPTKPKGMFAVWGANHNFYNTEWQESDSRGCRGAAHPPIFDPEASASTAQQSTALHALMGFFRAHVGTKTDVGFNDAFDPRFQIPASLEATTRIERAYADAALGSNVYPLESFGGPVGKTQAGLQTTSKAVTVTHARVAEHDPMLKAANLRWTSASSETYFEVPWAPAGAGVDATAL